MICDGLFVILGLFVTAQFVAGAVLDAVQGSPSPVVSLGGQCGGLTYKGPTGCQQLKGQPPVNCVVVDPYLHQCQIATSTSDSATTTFTHPHPSPSETCVASTLACAASCKKACPSGQQLTGTSCPFCSCAKPTPLCTAPPSEPTITFTHPHPTTPSTITTPPPTATPVPTDATTCVESTISCATMCAIGCPSGMIVTGTRCPFCSCASPTPLCTATLTDPDGGSTTVTFTHPNPTTFTPPTITPHAAPSNV